MILDFLLPMYKSIEESDVLEASSSGTVTLRMQWNQANFSPPTSVRVKIASPVLAKHGMGPGAFEVGSGWVDNGLGSEYQDTFVDGAIYYITQPQPKIVTLSVSNGIASITLNKSAGAQKGCDQGYHAAHLVSARAFDSGEMVVDSRNVTILLQGGEQWRKVLTGQMVQAPPMSWDKNIHHNVFESQPPIHFEYPGTTREIVPLIYDSPTTNRASYTVAIPTYYAMGFGGGGEQHYHSSICDFGLTFVGFATSMEIPTETYEWTPGGPSGQLPHQGGWQFPSKVELVRSNHLWQLATKCVWEATEIDPMQVTLRYTWSDGVYAEAIRDVSFVEPRLEVAQSDIAPHEPMTTTAFEFLHHGLRVPSGYAAAIGVFGPSAFDRHGASTVFGFVSAAAAIGAFWQPWLAVPSGIAAVLGTAAQFNDFDEDLREVLRNGDPSFSFWHLVGGAVQIEAPTGWNEDNWAWEIQLRPVTFLQRLAYDHYGMNGFVGRATEFRSWEQPMVNARKLRHYYEETPGAPSDG